MIGISVHNVQPQKMLILYVTFPHVIPDLLVDPLRFKWGVTTSPEGIAGQARNDNVVGVAVLNLIQYRNDIDREWGGTCKI